MTDNWIDIEDDIWNVGPPPCTRQFRARKDKKMKGFIVGFIIGLALISIGVFIGREQTSHQTEIQPREGEDIFTWSLYNHIHRDLPVEIQCGSCKKNMKVFIMTDAWKTVIVVRECQHGEGSEPK